ncbi:MAG: DUF763 domain-containing protein [Candidatus Micrarchaeota archaeon]|nr:DUF763 domain-containing protein [Candidatus Micrarchaeota archaeon]
MRSVTELPLHGGHAPRWLFGRMVRLSRAIGNVIMDEYGPGEFLNRICDRDWFQALSCAIGYDWHSSGTTTVTMGALKEGLNESGDIYIAGGKGRAGTNTPNDIVVGADLLSIPSSSEQFKESSRLAAKIDAGLVYDDIGIYHHTFIFTRSRKWGVVQQAMSGTAGKAIRFQWLSENVNKTDFADEPHTGIETEIRTSSMDLTSKSNSMIRESSVSALQDYGSLDVKSYPDRHRIIPQLDVGKRGWEIIRKASELDPKNYRELLLLKGVGRSTLRSLALISSLIYDKEISYRDPITYAYNLGGKDKIPFEINRKTYDSVVRQMELIVDRANLEKDEKYRSLKVLNRQISS